MITRTLLQVPWGGEERGQSRRRLRPSLEKASPRMEQAMQKFVAVRSPEERGGFDAR